MNTLKATLFVNSLTTATFAGRLSDLYSYPSEEAKHHFVFFTPKGEVVGIIRVLNMEEYMFVAKFISDQNMVTGYEATTIALEHSHQLRMVNDSLALGVELRYEYLYEDFRFFAGELQFQLHNSLSVATTATLDDIH